MTVVIYQDVLKQYFLGAQALQAQEALWLGR